MDLQALAQHLCLGRPWWTVAHRAPFQQRGQRWPDHLGRKPFCSSILTIFLLEAASNSPIPLFHLARSMRVPQGGNALPCRTYLVCWYSLVFFEAGRFQRVRTFPFLATTPGLNLFAMEPCLLNQNEACGFRMLQMKTNDMRRDGSRTVQLSSDMG